MGCIEAMTFNCAVRVGHADDDLLAMLKKIMAHWKETFRISPVGQSFHLNGNSLDRIWLGKAMVEALSKVSETSDNLEGLYAELFASENVFEALESYVCASSLGFHSNHATTGGENSILAVVFAEVAAFTGNRAIKPNAIFFYLGNPPGQAANLRITLAPI